jgi:outer membrane receptor for ferrienterochelin and colicin
MIRFFAISALKAFFFVLFSVSYLSAQCDFNKINQAMEQYEVGRFDIAKSGIAKCVQTNGFSTLNDKNKALRLLSLIAIAEDSIALAENYIKMIILNSPEFKADPHVVFDQLFRQQLAANQVVKVNSVSKHAEDIQTAPASVVLVTREEIISRGYVDIVDVLSDLPGFDISKIYSATYANVYQLGFRQENTERTLLMVDGVEENDIWSNIAYLSRQYPLSNIKAVEVLYGPSSTMYGPRSFVGAINILTLGPGERPSTSLEKKTKEDALPGPVYVNANLSGASFRTADADVTIGLNTESFKFSVTGRYFSSDEEDLSFVDFYDYAPSDIDRLKYTSMNLKGDFTLSNVNGVKKKIPLSEYITTFNIPLTSPYYNVFYNANNGVDSIVLTSAGVEHARQLDKDSYAGNVNGAPAGFSNHTKDYYVSAKLSFNNFLLGISSWRCEEGLNYYQDIYSPGSKNGSLWVPKNTTLYAKYDRDFERISISNLTTFHDHSLDKYTNRVNFYPFGLSASGLHLAHLLNPDSLIVNNSGTTLNRHGYANTYFYYEGKQFRNDFRIFYSGDRFSISSGLEFRSSLMQGDYLTYTDFEYNNAINQSNVSYAQELGTVKNQEKGSNFFTIFDAGVYTQGTYSIIPKKLILNTGARLDYNRIRANGGFGYDMSPRIVLMYNTPKFTVKAIFARGLQNVSQWTKFSTGGGRTPNPDLGTEKINFFDVSMSGNLAKRTFEWELMAYASYINDAVASSTDSNGITKNRNIGSYRILGTMATFRYNASGGRLKAYVNHTYMHPFQTDDGINRDFKPVRIGDIASHHANAGVTWRFHLGGLQNSLDIRANYVSDRPVGPGTTQVGNVGVPDNVVKAYLIFNGAFNVSHKKAPWMRLAIISNNILNDNILDPADTRYYHPGPRAASASYSNISGNVPYVPQRSRYLVARLTFDL